MSHLSAGLYPGPSKDPGSLTPDDWKTMCKPTYLWKNMVTDEYLRQIYPIIRSMSKRQREVFIPQRPMRTPTIEYAERAVSIVLAEWQNQGIWDSNWEIDANGIADDMGWKHEARKPSGKGFTSDSTSNSSGFHPSPTESLFPQEKGEFQSEASRPINMFLFQLAQERQRLSQQISSQDEDWFAVTGHNINSTAYSRVKERWIRWHIWDADWSTLPGMVWRHELGLSEWLEKIVGSTAVYKPVAKDDLHKLLSQVPFARRYVKPWPADRTWQPEFWLDPAKVARLRLAEADKPQNQAFISMAVQREHERLRQSSPTDADLVAYEWVKKGEELRTDLFSGKDFLS
ncbi:hypothetical protein F4778DRAFT_728625 [Xylariomycetidae sp. FL2044]|nr:hypothetical protein F4778DRAFT_728625 [Xylariomycetidae sp. FL2044]